MNEINSDAYKLLMMTENEVGKAVVGKPEVIRRVLTAILAGGHILMEDVPGVGKTTLALAFSRVLNMEYHRMQFTPDVMPSDVVGFYIFNRDTGAREYKQGSIMCNLFLADEINRTSSKTQSALLEVMEEGNVTVDGVTHPVPNPFTVIATQNPVGAAGTQMLPDSQLDRFMIRVSIGYPSEEYEIRMLKDRSNANPLDDVRPIVSQQALLALRKMAEGIYVDDAIYGYVTDLVNATRGHDMLSLGISPRGTIALIAMAKANAMLKNRAYVIPEDISDVFAATTAHRMILTPSARMNRVTEAEVARAVLASVVPPRVFQK
ncbi:MAG: MoxR family ATPase [Lachnospiraceae bacterium]|nr:MoxR family ATPase [Lachnospiraceae bacterium]